MSLVSVITPTFYRPLRLWNALASVGEQTYQDIEAIVINNGGPPVDDVIARYHASFGRSISQVAFSSPQSIGAARNAGAASARGDLLALLDDDDRYRPEHISRLVQALAGHPTAVVAYDDALIQIEDTVERDSEPHVIATCRLGLPYDATRFAQDDYLLTSALVIRRSAFDAVGGFDATLPFCEDWDLLLRLRDQGELLYVLGDIGVDYSMRIQANDHAGSTFDERRRATLDLLTERYHLPPLVPKTFYDVARDLGCVVVPV
jgi:glycosyltransferase involved in cell wall biosynthesis